MDGVGMYRSTRQRTVELGRGLTEAQGRSPVPATPEWTVKDNFSHLAGAAADILAGRLEGVATDPWTRAQVEARRDHSLASVVEEFDSYGESMDALVGAVGDAMDPRLFLDEWTHEQDIRGALSMPGGIDSEVVTWGAPIVIDVWLRAVAKAGLPPLLVKCDGHEYDSTGTAEVSLAVDGYTALRITVGRRSPRQIAELDWSGIDNPEPYFAPLVVFTMAEQDIVDAI